MNPVKFPNAHIIGRPRGWKESDGECVGLPAHVTFTPSGTPHFISIWKPTDEERQRIAAGENIALSCFGAQVPVALSVEAVDGEIVPFQSEGAAPSAATPADTASLDDCASTRNPQAL